MTSAQERGLLGIELELLAVAHRFALAGDPYFHGYQAMREIRRVKSDHGRVSHGTIYRALDRMEKLGLVVSRWEDPAISERDGRPQRCFYRLSAHGLASRAMPIDSDLEPGLQDALAGSIPEILP